MDLEKEANQLWYAMDSFSEKQLEFIAMMGAMRQCMTALIASHPEPKRLLAEWSRRHAGWVDAQLDDLSHPEFGRWYMESLAELQREIERAAGLAPD